MAKFSQLRLRTSSKLRLIKLLFAIKFNEESIIDIA